MAEDLVLGTLVKRYKRFFVDVCLESGESVTAHCPNTGRMTSCIGEGWKVALSRSTNPKRRLAYTMEYIHNGSTWIGVNTHHANRIVASALAAGQITEVSGWGDWRREVRVGEHRLDFMSERDDQRHYLEVKMVTLLGSDGWVQFPDTVSQRAQAHVGLLTDLAQQADTQATMFFLVHRGDGAGFRPAEEIDAKYAQGLRLAAQSGVQVLAYDTQVSASGTVFGKSIPIVL